jgi:flagellar motor switch protein FliM
LSAPEPATNHPLPASQPADGGAGDALPLSEGASPEALLDQDEIDGLLDGGEGRCARQPAVLALLSNQTVSYEGLPTLKVVLDQFTRTLSTTLRNLTSDNVEVPLESITSLRCGAYLDSVPLPAMIAVFRAVEWENYGLLTLSSPLIYSIIEVLLGGRTTFDARRLDGGRPFTGIERALVERLIRAILVDLTSAFGQFAKIEFRFERLETNPRHAAIARPTNGAVLFKVGVNMDNGGGSFEVLLPHAALEPVRDLLLQRFVGEKFGADSFWGAHLRRQMMVTGLELEAVLDEHTVPLGAVMNLAVGTTLQLNARPDMPVLLRRGHVPMFRGRLGRKGNKIAIRIDERLTPEAPKPRLRSA